MSTFNYYLDYLTKLQKKTFEKIYITQVTIAAMLTITTGTVCMFLYQIVEKIT